MTRREFMQELRERLARLSDADREAALAFYEEYFDEAGPDREQDVIRELGSPQAIASRILADHAVKEAREAPYSPRKGLSALWFVILAIVAAPLALPAIFSIVGVIVAVVVVMAVIAILAVAIVIGGIALFTGGFFALFATPASALILFGVAFLLWGIGKIAFAIIGAALSIVGGAIAWLFAPKGDGYGR